MTDHLALLLAAAALSLTSFSTARLYAWRRAERRVARSLAEAVGRLAEAVEAVAYALDGFADETRLTSIVADVEQADDLSEALRRVAEAAVGVTSARGAVVAVEGAAGETHAGVAGDVSAADAAVGWPLERTQAMTFATLRRADQGGRSTTYGAAVPLTVDAARSIGLLTAFFDSNGAAARGLAALEGVAAAAAPALESMLAAAEEHDRDVVTQLPTRTAFHHAVARESARARREGAPLSVVLVDVDGFRSLNQHPGPLTADHLLADIAQTIEALRPPESLLYRVGGDAFGLVLPGRTSEQAQEIASQLGPAQLERGVGTAPVHLSTGVAELQSTDDGVALAAKAQAALEETKLARRHPAGDSG